MYLRFLTLYFHTLYVTNSYSEVNTGSLLYKRIDEEIEEHKIS